MSAITVLNGDFMDAIRVEYKERGVTCAGTHAKHAPMVELDRQAQRLQRYLLEVRTGPFLP